ncbi:21005_t:CDS:2 [Dentiscutata erythropus]|uniref:21005_t:CDS:1 n=1 Tax=Dentiscutata erythropus TaxID=1348616 RepID=A0A9N8VT53_9GLOM|nr:21005_t:CDS:2 [Dentiscutata erythropus]
MVNFILDNYNFSHGYGIPIPEKKMKGGPNKSVIFTNMDDIIESFIMELSFDGIYSAWPYCKSKLVIDKASMPVIQPTFCIGSNSEVPAMSPNSTPYSVDNRELKRQIRK